MKIIKIGTFENGSPVGWHIDTENEKGSISFDDDSNPELNHAIMVKDDKVSIRGVEIVEWSKKLVESKSH